MKLLRTEITIPKKKLRNQFSYIQALQQQQEKQTNKQKPNKPKIWLDVSPEVCVLLFQYHYPQYSMSYGIIYLVRMQNFLKR